MIKVLILFKNPKTDSPTACHQGLGVTSTHLTMALRELKITTDCFPISNGEYLWTKLNSDWSTYTHIVLCAPFIDAIFLSKLFNNFHTKKFTVVYHSNLGFLSQDRFAVHSLGLYLDLENIYNNFHVASNSQILSDSIKVASGKNLIYLPNLFHLPSIVNRTQHKLGTSLNIGLFGAARVLKNWLTAGVASMIIANSLNVNVNLHISTSRDEGAANTRENLNDLINLNPKVKIIEIPWLDHDDFVRHLYGMDLLLQPSFTETFNNVTAEGASCGIPSVVSNAITWVPDYWKAEADNALSIAKVGISLLKNKNAGKDGWKALNKYNKNASQVWLKWLNYK